MNDVNANVKLDSEWYSPIDPNLPIGWSEEDDRLQYKYRKYRESSDDSTMWFEERVELNQLS